MSTAHQFTVSGDPRAAFELAKQALNDLGFSIGQETQPFAVEVERGSKGMTVAFGAFAGKKRQHLKAVLRCQQIEGANVLQLIPTTVGMAAGAIGVARANSAFVELSQTLAQRLYDAGILLATSVPTTT